MAVLSLRDAAEQTEKSKVDIWRAIQEGTLPAQRTEDGGFAIDPSELFRVFERQRPDERPTGLDATASPEASERPETMAVAFSALGAELKELLELPAEAPANDELRQNREERQVADLVERNAQLAELVGLARRPVDVRSVTGGRMPDVAAKKLCFVVGPIGGEGTETRAHADWLLDGIIRPVLADFPNFRVKRADQDARPGLIDVQMINDLLNAELVIADLSFLNPNTFYEIGIRHMTQKPIIHMQLADQQIPFDVSLYRALKFLRARFKDIEKAKEDLRQFVCEVLAPNYQPENPVTNAIGRLKLEQSATPEMRVLIEQIERLANELNTVRTELNTLRTLALSNYPTPGLPPGWAVSGGSNHATLGFTPGARSDIGFGSILDRVPRGASGTIEPADIAKFGAVIASGGDPVAGTAPTFSDNQQKSSDEEPDS